VNQLDLFKTEKEQTNFLHIIHNGKPSLMSMAELFDHKTYHTLHAVSYAASPKKDIFFDFLGISARPSWIKKWTSLLWK
jgi:hypothetical protein